MTRVIAVANQKGGVGKTTTAINVAACLAEAGFATLLVDLDPQCNASSGLGLVAETAERSVYGVLGGQTALAEVTQPSVLESLSVVPACPDLAGAEVELAGADDSRVRAARRAATARSTRYEFVFVDCPPSLGVLTVNGLTAAREALVPVQAEYYALEGLAQLLGTIDLVRERVNPDLRLLGDRDHHARRPHQAGQGGRGRGAHAPRPRRLCHRRCRATCGSARPPATACRSRATIPPAPAPTPTSIWPRRS